MGNNVEIVDVLKTDDSFQNMANKKSVSELDAVIFVHEIFHTPSEKECQLVCESLLPKFENRILLIIGHPSLNLNPVIWKIIGGPGWRIWHKEQIKRIQESICKDIDNLKKSLLQRAVILFGTDSNEYHYLEEIVSPSRICFLDQYCFLQPLNTESCRIKM